MPTPRKNTPPPSTTLVLSPCPWCGGRMWLTRIEPDRPGFEQRIFSCKFCGQEDCKVVAIGE